MTAAPDLDVYGRLVEAYEAEVPTRRSPTRVYEHGRRLRALEEWLAPRGLLDAAPAIYGPGCGRCTSTTARPGRTGVPSDVLARRAEPILRASIPEHEWQTALTMFGSEGDDE